MKKTGLFLLILLGFTFSLYAGKVSLNEAKLVGKNFYYQQINRLYHADYQSLAVTGEHIESINGTICYYVFDINDKGFIIVSADDCCLPVIGYSFDSRYSSDTRQENFTYWMDLRKQEIAANIKNQVQPVSEITGEWTRLSTATPEALTDKPATETDVAPLLISLWDQGFPYNVFCPADASCSSLGGHATTGCVATAMAQIMYYWRWPAMGTGSHCYTCPGYGTQCAIFDTTHYDFNGMVDAPTKECYPISILCYHAGVAVNMHYNSDGQCSSGAYSADVPNALKNYFNYASSVAYYQKTAFTTSSWNSLLTDDLDQGKPIQYSGQGSGGGHSWVCDGYQGTDYFHMNWGWSGSSNGYFYLSNLNPSGYTFNSQQTAVCHIEPNTSQYPTYCTGNTQVNTYDFGTIEDGSGPVASYQDNSNCSWLIAPDDSVKKITLTFTRFNTASGDEVKIYDGEDATATLLGTYSGTLSSMPSVTGTGPKMFVTFTSDGSGNANGWEANYNCTLNNFCASTTTTNEAWGTITDGSGRFPYRNSAICKWMIQPPNCSKLVLTVNTFQTEQDNDKLMVYDAGTGTVITTLSGHYTTMPGPFTTTTGKMMLQWFSNNTVRDEGWEVSWSPMTGTEDENIFSELTVFPNPASQAVNVSFNLAETQSVSVELLSLTGATLFSDNLSGFKGAYTKTLDVSSFAKGIYILKLKSDRGSVVRKIVVQ